jgi:hypothetical protein
MLYATNKKPKRKSNFDAEINVKFDFEEWDFKTLIEKINDCGSNNKSSGYGFWSNYCLRST